MEVQIECIEFDGSNHHYYKLSNPKVSIQSCDMTDRATTTTNTEIRIFLANFELTNTSNKMRALTLFKEIVKESRET